MITLESRIDDIIVFEEEAFQRNQDYKHGLATSSSPLSSSTSSQRAILSQSSNSPSKRALSQLQQLLIIFEDIDQDDDDVIGSGDNNLEQQLESAVRQYEILRNNQKPLSISGGRVINDDSRIRRSRVESLATLREALKDNNDHSSLRLILKRHLSHFKSALQEHIDVRQSKRLSLDNGRNDAIPYDYKENNNYVHHQLSSSGRNLVPSDEIVGQELFDT